MPAPRASSAQWPTAGERHARASVEYATETTDVIGGRSHTWSTLGTWWVKVSTVPFVVNETEASLLYQLEGPYWATLQSRFLAGTKLRATVAGYVLTIVQVENPQLRNRTLVAHCGKEPT